MDHFHRTEWLPFVTLSDILGEHPQERQATRRSA
jgi:hypothetical protein